jgi:hypothetical protein
MTKDEIIQQIRQDKTIIYGQPILHIFLQVARISLSTYLELDDKEKDLVKNVDNVLARAARLGEIDVIKDVLERKKIGADSLWHLFQGSQDRFFIKEVIILLIEKQDLDSRGVMWILINAKQDLEEIVKELGTKNIDKLDEKDFFHVMQESTHDGTEDQMSRLFLMYKTDITQGNLFQVLHYTKDSHIEEITQMIIEKKKDLKSDDVWNLIRFNISFDKPNERRIENVIGLLGTENIDKLGDEGVGDLIGMVRRHKSAFDSVFNMLLKHKTELSDSNIEDLVAAAKHAANNLTMNLQPNYPDEVIEKIIHKKQNLSPNNIYHMLWNANDKEKVINLIGIDNIRKMPKEEIEEIANLKGAEKIKDIFKSLGLL